MLYRAAKSYQELRAVADGFAAGLETLKEVRLNEKQSSIPQTGAHVRQTVMNAIRTDRPSHREEKFWKAPKETNRFRREACVEGIENKLKAMAEDFWEVALLFTKKQRIVSKMKVKPETREVLLNKSEREIKYRSATERLTETGAAKGAIGLATLRQLFGLLWKIFQRSSVKLRGYVIENMF